MTISPGIALRGDTGYMTALSVLRHNPRTPRFRVVYVFADKSVVKRAAQFGAAEPISITDNSAVLASR